MDRFCCDTMIYYRYETRNQSFFTFSSFARVYASPSLTKITLSLWTFHIYIRQIINKMMTDLTKMMFKGNYSVIFTLSPFSFLSPLPSFQYLIIKEYLRLYFKLQFAPLPTQQQQVSHQYLISQLYNYTLIHQTNLLVTLLDNVTHVALY